MTLLDGAILTDFNLRSSEATGKDTMHSRTGFWAVILTPALAVGVALVTTNAPVAQEDPIKARIALMKEVGKSMGPLGKIFKGEAEFDGAVVKSKAETIAANIAEAKGLFPEGSTSPDSRAKPEIWEKKDEFNAAADTAVARAKALVEIGANANEDAFKPAFAALGKGCGGCHKPFRVPKDE